MSKFVSSALSYAATWWQFGSFHISPQVDARIIQPICQRAFGEISYFVHEDPTNILAPPPDEIEVITRESRRLRIRYFSRHEERYCVTARIEVPLGKSGPFGSSPYLDIDVSYLDDEIVGALEQVAKEAKIPILTATRDVLALHDNARYLIESPYFIGRN